MHESNSSSYLDRLMGHSMQPPPFFAATPTSSNPTSRNNTPRPHSKSNKNHQPKHQDIQHPRTRRELTQQEKIDLVKWREDRLKKFPRTVGKEQSTTNSTNVRVENPLKKGDNERKEKSKKLTLFQKLMDK